MAEQSTNLFSKQQTEHSAQRSTEPSTIRATDDIANFSTKRSAQPSA
jgi:hypothetical protein